MAFGRSPGLVQQAVASDGRAILVACSDLLPEPSGALLVLGRGPVQVPADAATVMLQALVAGGAVQIENDVHAVRLGLVDRLVEIVPGIGAQMTRILLVFDHAPEKRQAHQIQAEPGQQIPITLTHPVVPKQLHQAFTLGIAKALVQGRLQSALVIHGLGALAHHPELLNQPVAKVHAFEVNRAAVGAQPSRPLGVQHGQLGRGRRG